MITTIRTVRLRYVPTHGDDARRRRRTVLEMQVRSIVAAAAGRAEGDVPHRAETLEKAPELP